MRLGRLIVLAAAAFFLLAASAAAKQPVRIFYWSAQGGPGHATAGGSIHGSTPVAGRPGSDPEPGSPPSERPAGPETSSPPSGHGGTVSPYPTVSSNSPVLSKPTGPNSFWYRTPGGQECLYQPNTNEAALCVNVVHPGTPAAPPAPPVDPTTLAVEAANRLSLGAGQISASPSAHADGLTGARSWFWLTPTPGSASVTVTSGAEHVTVSAKASSVAWSFGDHGTLDAGPGVPYRSGSVPAGAITHDYQTRCLPGDQRHDPYVLATCGPDGYSVTARVDWTIAYAATGPVTRDGGLTSRTTSTSMTYPVGEVRGFLASAGSS